MYTYNSAEEKKVIDQLSALVDFERQVKEIDFDVAPEVHLAEDGKKLKIVHGGLAFHGDLDRPLVHQIGGRIWPEAGEYSDVAERWKTSFERSKQRLEADIADMFSRCHLKMRYVEQSGFKRIYGLVSPHFVEVNQLDFREAFLEEARRSTALVAKTGRVGRTRLGNVVEFFHLDSPGFQVDLGYGLVYARNTGYDAYRVEWDRYILVCTNGLKNWVVGNQYKWYHNHRVDLGDFLNATVAEGLSNQRFLEERIHIARETALHRDTLGELIGRMSLAVATKQRLAARVEDESRAVGGNEWALSQALTYLGTHDRHISSRIKRQFTELGTDILEHSLDAVLGEEATVGTDGFYGLLLPNPVRYH